MVQQCSDSHHSHAYFSQTVITEQNESEEVIFRCSGSSSRLNRDETGDSRNRSRSVHLTVNPFNMKLFLPHLCLALLGSSEAHEYYDGSCPDFPPVGSLDWSRWSSGGAWRAAFKHNSRSSCIRCWVKDTLFRELRFEFIRYEFSGEEGGKRRVDETKLLPVLGRWFWPTILVAVHDQSCEMSIILHRSNLSN